MNVASGPFGLLTFAALLSVLLSCCPSVTPEASLPGRPDELRRVRLRLDTDVLSDVLGARC